MLKRSLYSLRSSRNRNSILLLLLLLLLLRGRLCVPAQLHSMTTMQGQPQPTHIVLHICESHAVAKAGVKSLGRMSAC